MSVEWIEIVVPCPVALADGLANELINHVDKAKQGVAIRKGEVVFWVTTDEVNSCLIETQKCLDRLKKEGWNVSPESAHSGVLAPEEKWRDAWKKYFHVTRLTRQIVVVPSWEEYTQIKSDLPIYLDPGQAFGTGSHASTQLILETLQELVDKHSIETPERVFDLGTGSGILAIASTLLWPDTTVFATDIDPLSIIATKENAIKNSVEDRISVSITPLEQVTETFPLVLANIQAHILRSLRDVLLPRIQQSGHLLISGILTSQIRPTCDFYTENSDVKLISIRRSALNPDWSSAHLIC